MNRAEHKLWAVLTYTVIFLAYFFLGTASMRVAAFNAAFLGYLIVIAASHFPDIDLDFGIKYHRSPVTHSALIPAALFIFYIVTSWEFGVLFILAAFFVGYGSHLWCDLLPPSSSAFGSRVTAFFEQTMQNTVPGDIRGVPEKYERNWLRISAIIIAIFLILTILRAHQFLPALSI